jgi:hypothetical protein
MRLAFSLWGVLAFAVTGVYSQPVSDFAVATNAQIEQVWRVQKNKCEAVIKRLRARRLSKKRHDLMERSWRNAQGQEDAQVQVRDILIKDMERKRERQEMSREEAESWEAADSRDFNLRMLFLYGTTWPAGLKKALGADAEKLGGLDLSPVLTAEKFQGLLDAIRPRRDFKGKGVQEFKSLAKPAAPAREQ